MKKTAFYNFAVISNRGARPTDDAHTLGIKVSDPILQALCKLGVWDPQTTRVCSSMWTGVWEAPYVRGNSIDSAATYAERAPQPEGPLPRDGSTLATEHPGVDAFAAMAVLVLRRLGLWPSMAEHGPEHPLPTRLRCIAKYDNASAEAEKEKLATKYDLDGLVLFCSSTPARPPALLVAVAACWLLWGQPTSPHAKRWGREATCRLIVEACGADMSNTTMSYRDQFRDLLIDMGDHAHEDT